MIKSRIKKSVLPFSIIRLWPQHHKSASDLKELLNALKKNKGACDEVWLCTEIGFPPLLEHAHSAKLMATVAEKIRALGIEPGLQIANTLGHGMSLLQDESGAKWPLMIDANGLSSAPTPCPRSKQVLTYIASMTMIYASWQPSSIWIDDDLRMNQHGALKYGCFCQVCVREFSAEQRKKYNRQSLVKALHNPLDGSVRLAWTKFNSNSLAGIADVIAQATHKVAKNCRLGFQQIAHEQFLYSGPDWNPTLTSLAKYSKKPSGARLGHGYYTDHSPRGMINKAFMISRQISRLPDCVDQICPEIEGYTHNAFGKSAYGMVVEASLDLAMGCNSLSYAIICSGHEPMTWYETLLSRLASYRPFWEKLVSINQDTVSCGVEVRLGIDHVQRAVQKNENPFAWSAVKLDSIYDLSSLGLPLCTSANGANAVILHADVVAGLSDKELRAILSGGVMMDGLAAMKIQERGFGKMLGVKVAVLNKPVPYRERISEDSINESFAGKLWNASTNNSGAYQLTALSKNYRVLGFYEDRLEIMHGLSTTLTENKAGGRIAIFGYYGWDDSTSGAKRNQYLAAADWVSQNKLPALIKTVAQVMVVPRVDAKDRLVSVFLLNASIDVTPPLEIVLRGVIGKSAQWITPFGKIKNIVLGGKGNNKTIKTPKMPAWSVACITVK